MRKKHIMAVIGILVILSVFIFAGQAAITGNAVYTQNNVNTAAAPASNIQAGSAQVVQLSIQNGVYQLNPARVVVNKPVRLVADMNSVRGCYRTVVIPDLGVRKTISATDNTIDFTPTKAGTFPMTCGMNMAGGQIIVEDANGNVPTTTQTAQVASTGGSCGSGSGGGCGCGG